MGEIILTYHSDVKRWSWSVEGFNVNLVGGGGNDSADDAFRHAMNAIVEAASQ